LDSRETEDWVLLRDKGLDSRVRERAVGFQREREVWINEREFGI